MTHKRKADKMDDKVDIKYCDTQHSNLDKRIDRLDNRLWWILTFVVITAIGMLSNIGMSLVQKAIIPQAQASTK